MLGSWRFQPGRGVLMVASPVPIQTKILRRERAPDEYRIYRAALEWGLTDPIVIESRDDFKSEPRWRDKLDPFHHQVTNLVTFCRRLPVTLLADDVGLGKTISAGLVASELMARSRVSKILVVCPKLLGPQWKDELETKFNIPAEIVTGSNLASADPDGLGAIITTYHSARSHLEKIPEDRFEMLVLDEAHKLRNLYGVDPPPQVAVRFRKALEERRFRYVLMLTATPIHNRLWDLYSLIDLLAVARGHQNPFGSEGMFARKFIADDRDKARQLKPNARDEFRSVVYRYMSRVRRNDAKLYFPDRVVQLHRVPPTPEEVELIQIIAKPIQKLNRLAQVGILQALTSSPQALMAQLTNMAHNRTVPQELAAAVREIVGRMGTSAKLDGLGKLIEQLRREKPDNWRIVVFTGRLETQTTIQAYLEERGIRVGIINGASGMRNQATLARFRKDPPDCHVIVSTEAGAEGINLQVANVLANYDLPWNPMIVEQRIGRVQRLASEHAKVSIFNVILQGTFEEYIVGRLMEKLQMASHAIGDVEALLEASGTDEDEDESGSASFEEKIRQLVLAALAGKNVEAATHQAEQSIAEAKADLEREKENIDRMLGGMDGVEYVGPRAPTLPPATHSIEAKDFTLAALPILGARISQHSDGLWLSEHNGGRELIRFSDEVDPAVRSTLYAPGSAAFARLVDQIAATGVHRVEDADRNPGLVVEEIGRQWTAGFGATAVAAEIEEVTRGFEGRAVVNVRATVAHDSYERLVEVPCTAAEHRASGSKTGMGGLPQVIDNAAALGLNHERLAEAAREDPAIAEFCRFYLERRAQEVSAAGDDTRKRKKLEDDFTPRLDMTLVALEGRVEREARIAVRYRFGGSPEYTSSITVAPRSGDVTVMPEFELCAQSGHSVPRECLARCAMTGVEVLRHLMVRSEISERYALPEHTLTCTLSGKRILMDEAALSDVTSQPVARKLLKCSALSRLRGEPQYFGRCEFTGAEILETELAISEVSGKRYRKDEAMRSSVSGISGYRKEFIVCHETHQPLLPSEAERCEVTGHVVRRGVLQTCAATGLRALPSEFERCAATGKWVLKTMLVTSSLSGVRLLEQVALRSAHGRFCAPAEGRFCMWSGQKVHPDDLRICDLAGVPVHFAHMNPEATPRLQPLVELLYGTRRNEDEPELWEEISEKASAALGGRCRVEAALTAPDRRHLAVCTEVRTRLGFKVNHAGMLYSPSDHAIVGHIALGKRTPKGWIKSRH